MKQLSLPSTQETPAHSSVHLKAGVEKGGTAGKKMIAIANAMAIQQCRPKATRRPTRSARLPGIDALGQGIRPLNHFQI